MKNEADFIKKISKLVHPYGKNVIVGIGDDTAVLQQDKTYQLLVTCDVQVEGVHFKKGISAKKLAEKAVLASISDISAMGGIPTSVLVSLAFPKNTSTTFLEQLMKQIAVACRTYNIALVGGNVSRAKELIVDICVLGIAKKDEIIYRSGAKPSDLVFVTGFLGHRKIEYRGKEALIIAKSKLASSMIDISDGLSTDISHICDASRVGICIFLDQIPVAKGISLDAAFNRGEDYELCFTANKKGAKKLINLLETRTKTKISVVGEILQKKEGRWIVDKNGKKKKLIAKGWDHLE